MTTGGVAKTVRYLNDTNTAYVQVVEERDENGVLQARYDYGDGDLQKLYRRDDNGSYLNRWYLGDGLESTRQLVDANGVVTDSYAYDAFGSTLQRAGETENTRLYNGQQQDEGGLYFLRARYYNTGNGRFLSHDPILGNSDDPASLHRYTYCANDSVNNIDPTGMFTMVDVTSAMRNVATLAANFARVSAPAVAGATNAIGAALFTVGIGQHVGKSMNAGVNPLLFDGMSISFGIDMPVLGGTYSGGGGISIYMDRESKEVFFAFGLQGSASFKKPRGLGFDSVGFAFNTRNDGGTTSGRDALSGTGFSATYPLSKAQWAIGATIPLVIPYLALGAKLGGSDTSVTLGGDIPTESADFMSNLFGVSSPQLAALSGR